MSKTIWESSSAFQLVLNSFHKRDKCWEGRSSQRKWILNYVCVCVSANKKEKKSHWRKKSYLAVPSTTTATPFPIYRNCSSWINEIATSFFKAPGTPLKIAVGGGWTLLHDLTLTFKKKSRDSNEAGNISTSTYIMCDPACDHMWPGDTR